MGERDEEEEGTLGMILSLSLSLSLTHTCTHIKRAQQREEKQGSWVFTVMQRFLKNKIK